MSFLYSNAKAFYIILPTNAYQYQKASLAILNGLEIETNPSKFN
jgi:hypothetical protein